MNIIYGDVYEKWCKENGFDTVEFGHRAYDYADANKRRWKNEKYFNFNSPAMG